MSRAHNIKQMDYSAVFERNLLCILSMVIAVLTTFKNVFDFQLLCLRLAYETKRETEHERTIKQKICYMKTYTQNLFVQVLQTIK